MSLYLNPSARSYCRRNEVDPAVENFHKQLPDYAETTLHSLPGLAKELGVAYVLMKDESDRFGLPSFKVLGASWGVFRAVAAKVGAPLTASLQELGRLANEWGIRLITCSDGNWGRAVARVARYMGIPVTVYLPGNIDEATRKRIASEDAAVEIVNGTYDDAVQTVIRKGDAGEGLLVMDHSWPGFHDIPTWVVEGYSTLLSEVDRQVLSVAGTRATHAIAGVGVGSWAESVVRHYKSESEEPRTTVITVEADTAACLQTSLMAGKMTTVETGDTIMCGFNCGTVSEVAWPYLRDGVDVSITVTDREADQATKYINEHGINGGPCGAATLAALRKLIGVKEVGLQADSVVVLFCTERSREYVLA
ncbi:tryptophan synthase beta subunit-like PLP-dependent enzyme [Rhizodiscina lignyota]|uniref:Tryptophan synthase beta subunit-like PLP-dependent enzyme n=1 Tax=Rhizodiscina lignyota TaxID=1504668 RepID=A0A9P4M8Y8_9PEZI|nr:tryptophan synthase beta subunit-like PLP-dependent enzyme [Rhizodiscina lignyota]